MQGGVETHCEQLYPRIAQKGHDVIVFARRRFVGTAEPYSFKGCTIIPLWHFRKAAIEAGMHTLFAICKAYRLRPDIVHIHAIGPSLLAPLARLLGMKVVITHHGMDYNRAKWGLMARLMLRAGEYFGVVGSHAVIAISSQISRHVKELWPRRSIFEIPNGVVLPEQKPYALPTECFKKMGLEGKRYIFALGRFVPEKGFDQLIDAWKMLPHGSCELVIAGDADLADQYSSSLKRKAKEAGVLLPGFIKGSLLHDLFRFAHTFVIPSSHEGLPIALLEAMSYGLRVVASDIAPHLEMELPPECYYPQSDVSQLATLLLHSLTTAQPKPEFRDLVTRKYDWDAIAQQTEIVYYGTSSQGRVPDARMSLPCPSTLHGA